MFAVIVNDEIVTIPIYIIVHCREGQVEAQQLIGPHHHPTLEHGEHESVLGYAPPLRN